ncbi:MAG: PilT/PilU family type 4a pilus ATPase [Deltaproteobacteria bacterium]|nr:PilT/PilU family type 4a pilus ATPase [Deltaproteobacteria bacterium]
MDISALLNIMYERGGSDLHLRVGSPPLLRVDGVLEPLEQERLGVPQLKEMQDLVLTPKQKQTLEDELAVDSSYSIEGFKRFRINVFYQRSTIAMVFRNIATAVPSLEGLGLPLVLQSLCEKPQGLVLVCGPTGSGKSSSLAAMLQYINTTRRVHVITIEDPIEYLFRDDQAFITQREIGMDTPDYETALKNAMRQDPDVMLIGEIRNMETMTTALSAAETGHLVFTTVHANSSYEAISRIVDAFPVDDRHQIRKQLSEVLIGSVFQRLIPLKNAEGRVPAVEILIKSPRIKDLIEKNELRTVREEMERSVNVHRMQSLEQSMIALLANKQISYKDAQTFTLMPGEMKLTMDKLGINEDGDIIEKGVIKDEGIQF